MENPFIFSNAGELNDMLFLNQEAYINSVTRCFSNFLPHPDFEFWNSESDDVFVMCRVGHRRYSLKLNLAYTWRLYRGENEYHNPSVSNYYRDKNRHYWAGPNALRQEFVLLTLSHPLVQLLAFGIKYRSKIIRFAVPVYSLAHTISIQHL